MQKRLISMRVATLLAIATVTAWAADVTGEWSGQKGGPNGEITLTANFQQNGTKLTGTMDGPGGVQIQVGKVEGDKILGR